jgi:hypothetical protein
MSAFVYGRATREIETAQVLAVTDPKAGGAAAQKAAALAQRIAALVPADVLLVYGIILASATQTGDDGSTTVTKPSLLKWSVPVLMGLAVVLFLIGKLPAWTKGDFLRMLIPPFAFVTWTLLSGTNGVVLWKRFSGLTDGWEFLVAGPLAIVLLAVSVRLSPAPP